MMQKIKMPGTGPPLFQNGPHARGMSVWWRLFPRGHPFATGIFRCIRTDEDVGWWFGPNLQGIKRFEEDVGLQGGFLSPNLQGFGNLEGLKRRNKAREPAWPSAGVKSHNPGSIAVGIAVGLSQRTEKAHVRTGLQPHSAMRLKPEELVCSSEARQLKQTAMEEKQPAMVCKDYQPGSIAVGFPEGMAMPSQRIEKAHARTGLQPHSAMRLKPEELVCSSVIRQLKQTAMEEKQPAMVCKDYQPGSIAVGFPEGMAMPSQRTEKAHVRTGLQPHLTMRLKPEELVCSSVARQLKQTAIKQPAMKEKEIAMDSLYGSPNLQGLGNLEGLKSNCKAREPAGHPPEAVCRSGTPAEACCVHINIMVRVRDGTVVHIRDDTAIPVRNGPDEENLHRRHRTAVRAGYSTGLGIRNASVNRPVLPPEWERNARGKSCRRHLPWAFLRSLRGKWEARSRAEGIPTGEAGSRKLEEGSTKHEVVPKASLRGKREDERVRNCDRKQ